VVNVIIFTNPKINFQKKLTHPLRFFPLTHSLSFPLCFWLGSCMVLHIEKDLCRIFNLPLCSHTWQEMTIIINKDWTFAIEINRNKCAGCYNDRKYFTLKILWKQFEQRLYEMTHFLSSLEMFGSFRAIVVSCFALSICPLCCVIWYILLSS
jgi:hypothetical protein